MTECKARARWLVPKFAEKRVFKAYTFCLYVLLIRFAYAVGLALLETVGLFMLDAEPCGLLRWARIIRGQGSAQPEFAQLEVRYLIKNPWNMPIIDVANGSQARAMSIL